MYCNCPWGKIPLVLWWRYKIIAQVHVSERGAAWQGMRVEGLHRDCRRAPHCAYLLAVLAFMGREGTPRSPCSSPASHSGPLACPTAACCAVCTPLHPPQHGCPPVRSSQLLLAESASVQTEQLSLTGRQASGGTPRASPAPAGLPRLGPSCAWRAWPACRRPSCPGRPACPPACPSRPARGDLLPQTLGTPAYSSRPCEMSQALQGAL